MRQENIYQLKSNTGRLFKLRKRFGTVALLVEVDSSLQEIRYRLLKNSVKTYRKSVVTASLSKLFVPATAGGAK